jgi:hypothetical protein
VPKDLQAGAFAAWERARQDIFAAWQRETDPRNLQPPVPKLNRDIARFLREHPPRGIDQTALEHCLDAIESPCSRREENQLREVFQQEYASHGARARAIIEAVEKLGLQPFQAPRPLPPIGCRSNERHPVMLPTWHGRGVMVRKSLVFQPF